MNERSYRLGLSLEGKQAWNARGVGDPAFSGTTKEWRFVSVCDSKDSVSGVEVWTRMFVLRVGSRVKQVGRGAHQDQH